jgi:DNA-binding transcriptional regulator YiaG
MMTSASLMRHINDPSSDRAQEGVDCNRDAMALLGICHRTIHTVQRPQNKAFLLRKPVPADPTSFGERLRVARVALGHTQTEMARKFDVSLSTVKFWEQGRTQPRASVLAEVEAFLSVFPVGSSGTAQQRA